MARFSPLWFTVAFSLAYVVVFVLDLTLFLYYPLTGEFHVEPVRAAAAGPAMHWCGLLASAAIVGLIAGLLAREHWIPPALQEWLWLAPALAMLATVYLLRQFFV
jgi:hypothetical protein